MFGNPIKRHREIEMASLGKIDSDGEKEDDDDEDSDDGDSSTTRKKKKTNKKAAINFDDSGLPLEVREIRKRVQK